MKLLTLSKILLIISLVAKTISLRIPSASQFNYHTDAQIQEKIDQIIMRNDDFFKKACPNTQLYHYLEIGTPSNTTLNAIIICNIHARQIITAQICLNWLLTMKNDSAVRKRYFTKVFYIANVNRQTFIDHQQGCVRKNQNNADTNRNFPTDFNHWKVDQDNQTYGGKKPFDQPLSECLNTLFTEHRPDLYIDIHSGTNSTVFYQQGVNNNEELRILNEINRETCNSELKFTTLVKDGQTINGHIFADIKVRLQVPFSLLIQTYLGPLNKGCFLMFNPAGITKDNLIIRYSDVIDSLFEKVSKSVKYSSN